jgi:hypothetical protein
MSLICLLRLKIVLNSDQYLAEIGDLWGWWSGDWVVDVGTWGCGCRDLGCGGSVSVWSGSSQRYVGVGDKCGRGASPYWAA